MGQQTVFITHNTTKSVLTGVKFINMLTLTAFTCENTLALNFYFINTFMLNFIHYLELNVCITFMHCAVRQKEQHKSIGAKAAYQIMVRLTSGGVMKPA